MSDLREMGRGGGSQGLSGTIHLWFTGPARFSGECDSEKPPYMAPEPIIGQLFGHVGPPGAEVSEDPVPHSGNVPTFLQAMGVEADSQLANFEVCVVHCTHAIDNKL